MKLFLLIVWLNAGGFSGPTTPVNVSSFYTEAACYQAGIKWEKRVSEYRIKGNFACIPVDFLP